MRSDRGEATPSHRGPPTQAEARLLVSSRSMNAGAHLLASGTFDHWPMFSHTAGYSVKKHPTFYIRDLTAAEFSLSFVARDEDADTWVRRG